MMVEQELRWFPGAGSGRPSVETDPASGEIQVPGVQSIKSNAEQGLILLVQATSPEPSKILANKPFRVLPD